MTTKTYLTFNPDLRSLSLFEPNNEEAVDYPSEDLPLNRVWTVWEQIEGRDQKDYSSSTKAVANFKTVTEFWRLWSILPQPSQLMLDKRMVRYNEDGKPQMVDAIMIFRDNVRPMWEDPMNSNGGHFEIRYRQSSDAEEQAQLDEHWNNLVLGVIGATIDPESMITGVRLVDKLHLSGKNNGFIRIEIWFTELNTTADHKPTLRNNLLKVMTTKMDGTRDQSKIQFTIRSHNPKSK